MTARCPEITDDDPRCPKCGAEITTGMMALFCPLNDKCEFWVPEVEDFKVLLRGQDAQ